MKKWVAFFSQTGSEIVEISKVIGRYPDLIIANRDNLIGVSNELVYVCLDGCLTKMHFLPKNPSVDDYRGLEEMYNNIFKDCIITLNGYLRIVPEYLCNKYEIYNGHPGLITKYPFLKGKDPQKKAYESNIPTTGCVIHKVTPEVDAGEIILSAQQNIDRTKPLHCLVEDLHNLSVELWIKHLSNILK